MRDSEGSADFWSALGGQLKPGLDVVVTATVDAARMEEAGPPTESFELTIKAGAASSSRRFAAGRAPGREGSVVVSEHGSATVQEDGTYLLPGDRADETFTVGDDGNVVGLAVQPASDRPRRKRAKPSE
jgi:hypothetical protein